MSWACSASSNPSLISNLFTTNIIRSPRLRDAFLAVDRAHFCPLDPYADTPQRIGYDATISAPHMHGHALTSLLPALHPAAKVLDVGSGSGYLCAVLGHLCPEGKVVGVEHIPQLVDMSKKNFAKDEKNRRMLDEGRVELICADGREGWEKEAPYDAIHVGAAAPGWPEKLVGQLKKGGRMFVPIDEGGSGQWVWEIWRGEDGEVGKKRWGGVMYVPLTDAKRFEA